MVTFYRNRKITLPAIRATCRCCRRAICIRIVNPNTQQLVTGWDVAGFPGPLSWDEETRRAKWKKIRWVND